MSKAERISRYNDQLGKILKSTDMADSAAAESNRKIGAHNERINRKMLEGVSRGYGDISNYSDSLSSGIDRMDVFNSDVRQGVDKIIKRQNKK